LTQRDLAELLGVSRTSVSAVENGHVEAWPKFRRNAAQILGMEEDELFPDDHNVGVEVVVVWWSRADGPLLSKLASTLLKGRLDEEQSS
jgi:transcriptional regulator with XRE-family HTH domain